MLIIAITIYHSSNKKERKEKGIKGKRRQLDLSQTEVLLLDVLSVLKETQSQMRC